MSKSDLIQNLQRRRVALGLSARKLSTQAGLTATYVWQMEAGKANPKSATITALDEALRGYEEARGFAEPPLSHDVEVPIIRSDFNDSFWVNEIDISASAGGGAFSGKLSNYEEVINKWCFPKSFLRGTVGGASDCSIITIVGDSMSPTLEGGDKVMIDTQDTDPRKADLFAILNGGLMVKRLQVSGERLMVMSDNKLYDTLELTPESVNIIGRVVCIIRLN